ncbi:MAG: tryptophan synthase subunit alpha, partial [Acholeplasmatales bacterium]|nr:tryptophan synthase subunit alpha [Acholeplasmatales bacterium]
IRKHTTTKVAIGFGISNPAKAKEMADISDGAIVGSAIVNLIAKYGSEAKNYIYSFCADMVNALE